MYKPYQGVANTIFGALLDHPEFRKFWSGVNPTSRKMMQEEVRQIIEGWVVAETRGGNERCYD